MPRAVWLLRSAEQGCDEAQIKLAFCYIEGRGVGQDLVQAATWCQKVPRNTQQGEEEVVGHQELITAIVLKAADAKLRNVAPHEQPQ